jgi:hypothetical protein
MIQGLAKDAECAGRYAVQHALGRPRPRSTMTIADYDLIAWWAATWAGHWGRLALAQQSPLDRSRYVQEG